MLSAGIASAGRTITVVAVALLFGQIRDRILLSMTATHFFVAFSYIRQTCANQSASVTFPGEARDLIRHEAKAEDSAEEGGKLALGCWTSFSVGSNDAECRATRKSHMVGEH